MDEVNARLQPQNSVCSNSSNDENLKNEPIQADDRKICLVGNAANDSEVRAAAETFGFPIVTSVDGIDFMRYDEVCNVVFVLESFEGKVFENISYRAKFKEKTLILGTVALQQLANKNEKLPYNVRPLFNLAMSGVAVCFSKFSESDKGELAKLILMIHQMGGSVRRNMSSKVTHLISNFCGGEKYQYAFAFRVPVMNLNWVYASWENRYDVSFVATLDMFMSEHKLKPFHGARVCFLGFPEEEEKHMAEVLIANGGTVTTFSDPSVTHVVVDESTVAERPDFTLHRAAVVKAEWFWTSVQKEFCLDVKEYRFEEIRKQLLSPSIRRNSHQVTPGGGSSSASKRKRRLETLSSLVHTQQSPSVHKRRSSVSDAGLLSLSSSFLECTASPDKALLETPEPVIDTPRKGLTPRHQVFLELVQTESNYVSILHTIMNMFKRYLEEMPEEEALLNNMELKLIFGKLPPIYETHVNMLNALKEAANNWTEEQCIGDIVSQHSTQLLRAYPPYINFFEEMKEVLTKCDQTKPRFHAFLKACQTRPECGRQSLQELMIRPVQRLGSICLLLNDILKHTSKKNPDHAALEKALAALREVMRHINEDKRKAEAQVTLFNIFNDIDNCPPDIVSSHRNFIARSEVVMLSSSDVLSSKGNNLVLFLFSDQLEVVKKKSKYLNSLKSPTTGSNTTSSSSSSSRTLTKPYKHVKVIPLSAIKRVIDIKETEECQRAFSLMCLLNDESTERIYSFALVDENTDKNTFLRTLVRQMANNACTADADQFLAYLESHQLDIDTSDVSRGTFSRAVKFANKTRLKVERAFSFNKTPSKLKRAVSSMMSPFGSSTNLTPSSQLANMRLASYNNINVSQMSQR